MLTKIKLYYKINKFYDIFGEYIGSNFINKLSDITKDNLYDVLFDLNEVLTVYEEDPNSMTVWLKTLYTQIINFCERKFSIKKILTTTLMILLAIYLGWTVLSVAEILTKNLSDYNFFAVCIKLLEVK